MGNCSKKRFFSIRDQDRAPCAETGCFWDSQNELRCKNNGIRRETVRWTRKPGVFGNRKTNYVVKTTELGRKLRAVRGNGVFWGFTERITLLKQRNWRENRAPDAETGCFRDSQNELRCKNNGIRGETARRAQKRGVLGIHKTNYVVKTTELGRKPRGRCVQQMESCAGGGTLSKKCVKNANWTGAAALSPRRRGYAAKIMRRKNARRKFGKRASGESHYRNPCGIIRNIW